DPQQGLRLLRDETECPPDLREDEWRLLEELCRRDGRTRVMPQEVDLSWDHGGLAGSPRGDLAAGVGRAPAASRGPLQEVAIRLCDLTSGEPRHSVSAWVPSGGALDGARKLCFSPDGSLLAFSGAARVQGAARSAVHLFETATGRLRHVLPL